MPGDFEHAGVFNGAEDIITNCFAKILENIPSFTVTPIQFWEVENTIFVKVELKGEGLSAGGLHMHVVTDGKAQSFEAFEDTQIIAKMYSS